MKVLVGCEFSGIVRDAFLRAGHDAISCDVLPSESPGPHIVGDVRDQLEGLWDLALFFPPCTHLALSGARWWPDKLEAQARALDFVRLLLDAPLPRIALENPVGLISTAIRPSDQIIHPWQFGHGEKKRTCLWLKGLPPLRPTDIVEGRTPRSHMLGQTKNRWKHRSRTYVGIAEAMAQQWGTL